MVRSRANKIISIIKEELSLFRLLLGIILSLFLLFILIKTFFAPSSSSFSFAAAGDWGARPDTTVALKTIKRLQPDFAIALGDLSYGELEPERAWCDYVKSNIGEDFPFLLVAGNHEDENVDDGIGGFIDNFIECLPVKINPLSGNYGKRYYFDYKNLARFIIVARSATLGGEIHAYDAGDRRYEWVARAIDSAREQGIPWVIVGVTDVCLSMGVQTCEGADLSNLLASRKVDLVLQAHEHGYQRSKQLALSKACPYLKRDQFNPACIVNQGSDGIYIKGKGTVWVINGAVGGGSGLQPINVNDPDAGYFASWMGSNHKPKKGFSLYSVSAEKLQGKFVGTTGGSSDFEDTFVIEKDKDTRQKLLIDHKKPIVKIIYPIHEQILPYGSTVEIQVDARDNIGVKKVEFVVNSREVCNVEHAPFNCNWQILGTHLGQSFSIVAKAFDAAGNISYKHIAIKTN